MLLIDTRDSSGLSLLISEARKRFIPIVSIHDLGLNPVASDIGIDASVKPEYGKRVRPRCFPVSNIWFWNHLSQM
ncbi:MAG: hypothetical protein MZW92_12935 [Comamonadaceae bacterium]|nr:hypothetical protein [Comamonadaceae bacterium]